MKPSLRCSSTIWPPPPFAASTKSAFRINATTALSAWCRPVPPLLEPPFRLSRARLSVESIGALGARTKIFAAPNPDQPPSARMRRSRQFPADHQREDFVGAIRHQQHTRVAIKRQAQFTAGPHRPCSPIASDTASRQAFVA